MLETAREAVELVRSKTRQHLSDDRVLQLALTRLVEIVGEAAAQIPKDDQLRFPDIPWPAIIGMHNRLVHAYIDVDLDVLWSTVTADLPDLIALLERAAGSAR
jgi:uncharacterized protein with HEPN domain